MNKRHSYVLIGEQEYLVSTVFTFDRRWETMVFESKNGVVESWEDLYAQWYDSADEAMSGHAFVVKNLKELLLV
jgi:hypothetical protein